MRETELAERVTDAGDMPCANGREFFMLKTPCLCSLVYPVFIRQ
ncbi:hypothetical protein D3OALGB2SA_1223 [Olavius algarvensis associated proteobacterium Delta 3]|nr:hypothetical protein D3OALGB2SA_1223 [Olavius algarvensis associated proteobacterium Delta 3]